MVWCVIVWYGSVHPVVTIFRHTHHTSNARRGRLAHAQGRRCFKQPVDPTPFCYHTPTNREVERSLHNWQFTMAARRKTSSPQQAKHEGKSFNASSIRKKKENTGGDVSTSGSVKPNPSNTLAEAHLPPFSLVCIVILCSGFLFMLGLRDFMTTGRNILGDIDEAFLVSRSTRTKKVKKNYSFTV